MGVEILEDMPVRALLDHMSMSINERPDNMPWRGTCLHWACMLLAHRPAQMLSRATLQQLEDQIFDTLVLPDEEVVLAALQVLAGIMSGLSTDGDRLEDEDSSPDEPRLEDDPFVVATRRLLRFFCGGAQNTGHSRSVHDSEALY